MYQEGKVRYVVCLGSDKQSVVKMLKQEVWNVTLMGNGRMCPFEKPSSCECRPFCSLIQVLYLRTNPETEVSTTLLTCPFAFPDFQVRNISALLLDPTPSVRVSKYSTVDTNPHHLHFSTILRISTIFREIWKIVGWSCLRAKNIAG